MRVKHLQLMLSTGKLLPQNTMSGSQPLILGGQPLHFTMLRREFLFHHLWRWHKIKGTRW
jgi:hypothetical protein